MPARSYDSTGPGGAGDPNVLDPNANDPEFKAAVKKDLEAFWVEQGKQMASLSIKTEQEFKVHNDLPLARIKRIMKSDEDVRMISAEAPVMFAKACEMFILELSLRSFGVSERNKRKTLQRDDLQNCVKEVSGWR